MSWRSATSISEHAEGARPSKAGGKADMVGDYRKLLDRKDIDVVTIGTPDHWHTQDRHRRAAGRQGRLLRKAAHAHDRRRQADLQGGQGDRPRVPGRHAAAQRGRQPFLMAVALCHHGRLGKIKTVECRIGGGDRGGPFKETDPPSHLNWDLWLGQAPLVPYIKERCHYEFRWWYEYSGGKMTDWGAHHVDIAQWAINALDTGPVSIEGTAQHQNIKNGYNTAIEFLITCKFASGAEMVIRHDKENGVFIEGDKGRIFVSRGALKGKPVEDLKDNPLPEDAITKLYKGKKPGDHMRNFFECVKTPRAADLGRLHAPPRLDDVPPGQHRDPPRPPAEVEPRNGTDRRGRRSQLLAKARAAQRLRDHGVEQMPVCHCWLVQQCWPALLRTSQ